MTLLELLRHYTLILSLVMLFLALFLSLCRLVLGPTLPDRVVALDLVAIIVVGLTMLDAMRTGEYHFLPAAIGLSLTSFLGSVAFSVYLQRRQGEEE
jgi:multicomponent Na+:H+ antiporter subunit F